jgi:PAS domain S-box-containing protein
MGKPIRVLIVEDTEEDAALLIRALLHGGYDPTYEVVETPDAMSDALNRQEWDLAISDYSMPCFSGLAALKLLQDKDPDLSFILLSGQIGEDVAVDAMKAGAHDYMLKSNPARLIPAVERELRDTKARRVSRRNEQALWDVITRYCLIAENTTEGIWHVDDSNTTTFVNQKMADMVGYTIDDMVGQTPYAFMDEEWSRVSRKLLHERSMGLSAQCELKYRCKDGTDLWALVNASPIFHDDGSYAGSVAIINDITLRKRAERELQERERQLSVLYASMSEGLAIHEIVYDSYGKPVDYVIRDVNPAFEILLGLKREISEGTRASVLYGTGEAPYLDIYAGVASTGEPVSFDTYFPPMNKHFSISVFSLAEGMFATVFRDVSEKKRMDEALRAREAQLRRLTDNMLDIVIEADAQGCIQYATPSSMSVLGYASDNMVGRSLFTNLHPDDCERVISTYVGCIESGSAVRSEYRLRHADGNYLWLETSCRPLVDEQGKIVGAILSGRDITDRRQTEDTLIDIENRLRSIFSNSSVGIILSDENGHALMVNEAYCNFLGYSEQELLGMHFQDFTVPEDLPISKQQHADLITGRIKSYVLEKRYIRKDGSILWVSITVSSAQDDPDRKKNNIVTICEDISARKRVEQTICESEARLRLLTDNMLDMIVQVDARGFVKYASPSYNSVLGHAPQYLFGKWAFVNVHPDDRKRTMSTYVELVASCSARRLEYRLRHVDGHYLWVETIAQPLCDDQGKFSGAILMTRDVTARKQAEDDLRASETKYRTIFNATGTAAMIVEEDSTISLINREFQTLSGYAKEEIEGTKRPELFGKDHLDEMTRYHYLRRADPDSAPIQYETEFITKQSEVRQVIVNVSMLPGTKQSIAFLLDISAIKRAEKAIKQSEAKFRTLFEDAPVGMGIARAGKTLMANRAYLRIFGYASVAELERTPFLNQIAAQCRSEFEETVGCLGQGKEASRAFEAVGLRKDGSEFPLYVETDQIELPDGPATIGYFSDITERRNAQELKDKYLLLSVYGRDIIMYVRRSDGHIIEANDAAVEEYGFTRTELLGMTIKDLRPEYEHLRVDEQMRHADETGILFDAYHIRKDGSTFPVEVSSQGITIEGDRILLSIIRNITWRRQQEEKLLIANTVFENTPTGIIVINGDTVVQRINPAFTAITGYSEDDVIGRKAGMLGYDVPLTSADCYRGEAWRKRKDGTSYLEGFVRNAIRDKDGNVLQYIKNVRDITEDRAIRRERQLLLEQQERMQKLSSLSALSAGIGHEIAQPLNAIKLSADGILYLQGKGLFKQEDFMDSMRDISGQVERISMLINQMRSFAKTDCHNEVTPCNLNKAVGSIINILGRRLADHGITAKIEVEENLPAVAGTASAYEELVLNLLTNAIHALDSVDRLEKEITIRTFSQTDKAVMEITDNATGICDDIKGRIFEPLFTTKKTGEGMGLGLSIVKSIVERFNGSIDVQNSVNGGAIFTVRLPAIINSEK